MSPQQRLDDSLTPQFVLTLRIMTAALAFGILSFVLIVVVVLPMVFANDAGAASTQESSPTEAMGAQDDGGIIALLSAAVAVLALINWPLGGVMFRFKCRRLRQGLSAEDAPLSPSTIRRRLQEAVIIRLALFESVALFGVVVLLLGSILEHQHWWLHANLIPAVVVLYLIVNTWPNHDRLRNMVFPDQDAGIERE